jgi:hypothetical protein
MLARAHGRIVHGHTQVPVAVRARRPSLTQFGPWNFSMLATTPCTVASGVPATCHSSSSSPSIDPSPSSASNAPPPSPSSPPRRAPAVPALSRNPARPQRSQSGPPAATAPPLAAPAGGAPAPPAGSEYAVAVGRLGAAPPTGAAAGDVVLALAGAMCRRGRPLREDGRGRAQGGAAPAASLLRPPGARRGAGVARASCAQLCSIIQYDLNQKIA